MFYPFSLCYFPHGKIKNKNKIEAIQSRMHTNEISENFK